MSFELKIVAGRGIIVAQQDRLTLANMPVVDALVMPILDEIESLTIDLSDVSFIDSGGLVILVSLARTLEARKKGPLRLSNVDTNVQKLIDMCHLSQYLELESHHVLR
jgi:anti-anti-sigma factor